MDRDWSYLPCIHKKKFTEIRCHECRQSTNIGNYIDFITDVAISIDDIDWFRLRIYTYYKDQIGYEDS